MTMSLSELISVTMSSNLLLNSSTTNGKSEESLLLVLLLFDFTMVSNCVRRLSTVVMTCWSVICAGADDGAEVDDWAVDCVGTGAGTPWAPTRRRMAAALDELMYNK